jgi:hypothetical protein
MSMSETQKIIKETIKMMTIHEYFNALTFEAWEEETELLMALYEDEEADLTEWAAERNIDLAAGHICHGCFFTYFQEWVWSTFED